jgi:hypothetical protein
LFSSGLLDSFPNALSFPHLLRDPGIAKQFVIDAKGVMRKTINLKKSTFVTLRVKLLSWIPQQARETGMVNDASQKKLQVNKTTISERISIKWI